MVDDIENDPIVMDFEDGIENIVDEGEDIVDQVVQSVGQN